MIDTELPRNRHTSPSDISAPWRGQRFYPNLVFRADGTPAPLSGVYAHTSGHGSSLFLLLNGPSLKKTPLDQLRRRGLMTMGLNNGWLVHRPNFWCCTDPPNRFADVGWKDPGIIKFVPAAHVNSKLGVMQDGKKRESAFRTGEMPATYFFRRNTHFQPHTFFEETSVAWGCDEGEHDASGVKGNRSTMLCCLRLAHFLGFCNVYLVGADFNMPAKGSAYAFDERKSEGARESNNTRYGTLDDRFADIQSVITRRKMKFHIINVTPSSKLKAFPTMDFKKAVDKAAAECEKSVPTEGWYEK